MSEFVGHGNGIDGGSNDAVINPVFHPFTKKIEFKIHISNTIYVLPGCFHLLTPLPMNLGRISLDKALVQFFQLIYQLPFRLSYLAGHESSSSRRRLFSFG